MELERINKREALSYLGYRNKQPDRNISSLLDKYEQLLLKSISPRFIYKVLNANTALLKGKDIRNHIENSDEILIFAATLGIGADNVIRSAQVSDVTGAVIADALADAAIEDFCDMAEKDITEKFPNRILTSRFSPGYGDFPLDIQSELISTLDAVKRIGLTVTEGGFLLPVKSVTAVIGLKRRGDI